VIRAIRKEGVILRVLRKPRLTLLRSSRWGMYGFLVSFSVPILPDHGWRILCRTDRQVADSRRDLPSKHANSSLEFWVQWLADTFFALHSSAWPISAVERTKHRRSWSGEYFVNRYGKLQMTGVLQ
jgi:hypothetical protein